MLPCNVISHNSAPLVNVTVVVGNARAVNLSRHVSIELLIFCSIDKAGSNSMLSCFDSLSCNDVRLPALLSIC